jgi:hypothetical protein
VCARFVHFVRDAYGEIDLGEEGNQGREKFGGPGPLFEKSAS